MVIIFTSLWSKLFQIRGPRQEIEKSVLCKDVFGILKLFEEYLVGYRWCITENCDWNTSGVMLCLKSLYLSTVYGTSNSSQHYLWKCVLFFRQKFLFLENWLVTLSYPTKFLDILFFAFYIMTLTCHNSIGWCCDGRLSIVNKKASLFYLSLRWALTSAA